MTNSTTLAEGIVEALVGHGVRRLFGIPGGGSSLALIDAASATGIDFVLTRTETAAAIMAAVTGELTEIPGVVLTGIGPGATSAVNGIAYASLERAPLILFTDGPAASVHQALDQQVLFAPITKSQGRLRPENAQSELEAAIRTATTPPFGPVQFDLTAGDAAAPINLRASEARAPCPGVEADALDRARELLVQSRRRVLVVGLEARWGPNPAALERLVDVLQCPVLLTYKAKGVLSDRHPNTVGIFTGAVAESVCIEQADLIITYGLDPIEIIPGPWRYEAPVLELRTTTQPELPTRSTCRLIGSLSASVEGLTPIDLVSDWLPSECESIRKRMFDCAALAGSGHTAQTVIEAVFQAAPDGCRLTVDSGAHMFTAMNRWYADEPFGVLKSSGLSTMGYALPAAIASHLQEPQRPVVAITGDAGLMMCISELATAAERRCPIIVVALNDQALSLIDIKQQRQGRRRRGVDYPGVDLSRIANAMGCRAWRVETGDDFGSVLAEAFATDGPTLIDVVVDPSGYGEQLRALRG